MSEPTPVGELPARFLTDLQVKSFQATLGLISRRSQAATDYIRALPATRQPGDLLALQLAYWTQMLDDYAAAMAEGLAPLTELGREVQPAAVLQPVQVERAPAQAA